eukprot:3797918-Pyramimonas_sp.AAC.1
MKHNFEGLGGEMRRATERATWWTVRAIGWMLRAIWWTVRAIGWTVRATWWTLRAIGWMLRDTWLTLRATLCESATCRERERRQPQYKTVSHEGTRFRPLLRGASHAGSLADTLLPKRTLL